MATCGTIISFAAFANTASSTKIAYTAIATTAGDPATCPGPVVLSSTEYGEMMGQRVTTRADAEAIGVSLMLLLAIAFGFKMIGRALNTGDHISDEKH